MIRKYLRGVKHYKDMRDCQLYCIYGAPAYSQTNNHVEYNINNNSYIGTQWFHQIIYHKTVL